ncbi:Ig-like domain-containing protein, partial [Staphylococcus hominis]|uniref:Ig-like domain-containing protein n=1 Tax=Staphylococcus hominis TaxID=1290 RepID=UPI002879B247
MKGKKYDFLPNRLNKYSIRKFTVGTASLLIGATLVFGIGNEAKADEISNTTGQVSFDNESSVKENSSQSSELEKTPSTEEVTKEEQSSTEETTKEEQPSTEETTKEEQSSTEETTKEEQPSTEETTKEEQPSTEETTKEEQSSTEETTKEEQSSTEETTKEEQPSTEETTKKEQPSTEEVTKEEQSSTEETTKEEQPSTEETTKEEQPSTEETTKEEQPSTEEVTKEEQSSTEETTKEEQPSTEEVTKEEQPSTEETTKEEQPSTEETTKEEQPSTEEVTEDTDLNTNTSTLQEQLENTENKEEIVNQYLTEQLSEEETDAIIEIANIDYNNATTEEINDEILKAALINLSNEIDSEQPLATRATRMLSAINTLAADIPNETKYQFPTDSDLAYLLRDLKYDATKVNEDTSLRYAGLNQIENADSSSIKLQVTKWLGPSSQFTNGGNINISFPQEAFSSQIESITLNGVQMTSNSDGSNWSAPVNSRTVQSGLIGVVTNHDLIINLKDNQTLQSLGYTNDKPVYVLHTWTTNEGEVAAESIDTSFISPTVETDVDNSKSTGFTAGKVKNQIHYNKDNQTIDSVHTFKPNENFLQTDYNWVLYIKEQIPQDLLPYIDLNNIELYVSDENGNKISENRVVNVFADDNGLVDTSKVDSISILDNNTVSDLNNARGELDRNVFYGALGQSRSYTLSYSLLPGVTLEKIAKDLNESTEDARLDFSSWLEADYVDNRLVGSDNGAPFQPLEGSYATSYLDFYDYDNDGIPDIIDEKPEVVDVTAPKEPVINDVTSEDKTITGTSEPNSTVTVTFPDGTTASATADASGNYTIGIPDSEDLKGDEELSVVATDAAGNVSVDAGTTVLDKTPPEVPTINPVTSEDKTITGKAEPNSTVTVTFPDGTTANATTDGDGNYTIDIPANEDLRGGEALPVTSTDGAGNQSGAATTTVTDTTAPTVPTINPVTSEDTTITGHAEPGSTVTVTFSDGNTATGTTDADGNYVINIPTDEDLKGGEELPVTSTDKAGNKSDVATTEVTDTTAPEAPTVNPVTSDDTTITGKAEPNSTITVTFPDGTTATGNTDADGNYVIDIPSNEDLKGGETLPVTSTDKAGNTSQPASTVVTDTTAPTVPSVNPVTSDDTQITGKAEPNSTVTVTFPDGTTASGTTDADGNYTIDIPANEDLKGGETLPVTATDKDGNKSEEATTTVSDKTAPEAPTVNPVTSDDTQITGKAEPNSTVTVTFPDGHTASGTTDADGNYVINIPSSEDLKGGETLPVTATDKAGNTSEQASTVVTDTTAPTVPSVNPVTSDDTQITGKAEPGSTVTVTFPDGTTATGTTGADGNYTIDIPANEDLKGGETLPVTATDKDGNKSEPATTVVTDTTAPTVPSVNPVTSDDTQITGKAEPGSTVTVTFPDGNTASGTTDEDGNYVINIPSGEDLKGGETLPVTATDKDGNKSEPATTVVTDTTAPTVPTVNPVTSDDKTITGKAEPGSTVTVTFPDGNTASGTTDEDGNYTITIPTNEDLKGGEALPVTSTDKAGNTSAPATTVVTDTTAPTAPSVNPVTSDDKTITGKAEPGSTVTVTFPDGTTTTGTADQDGNYVIDIPANEDLKGGETLPVTATDKDGNKSEPTSTVVTDTTAPTVPSVNPVTSDDKTITGKAEPGSTVTVTFPDGTTATGTTDENGNY